MKGYFISEEEVKRLLSDLELEKFQINEFTWADGKGKEAMVAEIHRRFRYVITSFLEM